MHEAEIEIFSNRQIVLFVVLFRKNESKKIVGWMNKAFYIKAEYEMLVITKDAIIFTEWFLSVRTMSLYMINLVSLGCLLL